MSYLKPEIFLIDCLTNTLAGGGKANFGVIDQLVQRDVASHLPQIHASSIKGAIKEFCSHNNMPDSDMLSVFGSAKKMQDGSTVSSTQVGEFKFLDAHLLTIPVRSNKAAFIHITSPEVLLLLRDFLSIYKIATPLQQDIDKICKLIGDNDANTAIAFTEQLAGAVLEDIELKAEYIKEIDKFFTQTLESILPGKTMLVSNAVFKTLTNDLHLPVIARNYLENGESANLWYEQVVPRKSRFWFSVLYPETRISVYNSLSGQLSLAPVQIGANASVGYGYTTIKSAIK